MKYALFCDKVANVRPKFDLLYAVLERKRQRVQKNILEILVMIVFTKRRKENISTDRHQETDHPTCKTWPLNESAVTRVNLHYEVSPKITFPFVKSFNI